MPQRWPQGPQGPEKPLQVWEGSNGQNIISYVYWASRETTIPLIQLKAHIDQEINDRREILYKSGGMTGHILFRNNPKEKKLGLSMSTSDVVYSAIADLVRK